MKIRILASSRWGDGVGIRGVLKDFGGADLGGGNISI